MMILVSRGDMQNIMKLSIIFLALGLFIRPTPSYAWHGDHFRFGLNLSVPVGYYDRGYYDRGYYDPDYVYVSPPPVFYQPIIVNGVTYYVNNGNYYLYTSYGYQLVSPPVTVVQSAPTITTQPIQVTTSVNTDDSITLNIPNDKGGYTAVVLKRSGSGFVGPQGEFYSQFPKVSQLKVMYGK